MINLHNTGITRLFMNSGQPNPDAQSEHVIISSRMEAEIGRDRLLFQKRDLSRLWEKRNDMSVLTFRGDQSRENFPQNILLCGD
jgi:hypothetical protein